MGKRSLPIIAVKLGIDRLCCRFLILFSGWDGGMIFFEFDAENFSLERERDELNIHSASCTSPLLGGICT